MLTSVSIRYKHFDPVVMLRTLSIRYKHSDPECPQGDDGDSPLGDSIKQFYVQVFGLALFPKDAGLTFQSFLRHLDNGPAFLG